MRLVDSLFFALAFLVDSIVCPRTRAQNLDSDHYPYTVVRMSPAELPGVLIQLPTKIRNFLGITVHSTEDHYPPQDDVYAVIWHAHFDHEGNLQSGKIIGTTDFSEKLYGIKGDLGRGCVSVSYQLGEVADSNQRMQRLFMTQEEAQGLWSRLPPRSTYFKDAPPNIPRRIMYQRAR